MTGMPDSQISSATANALAAYPDQPAILIAGHSHAYALGLPGAKTDALPEVVPIAPGFLGLIGPWPRSDDYWRMLAEKAKEAGHVVALSFLGNDHLACFLIEEQPFDFVSTADPEAPLRADAPIVPESLIRAMFKPYASSLPAILRRLKDSGVRTFVLGTPPPKEELGSRLATEPFFPKRLEALGMSIDNVALCPSPLQLKLWRLIQAMLEEAAVENGATFVPYPRELANEAGYLRGDYARDDVTHANEAAGAAVRAQLESLVAEMA